MSIEHRSLETLGALGERAVRAGFLDWYRESGEGRLLRMTEYKGQYVPDFSARWMQEIAWDRAKMISYALLGPRIAFVTVEGPNYYRLSVTRDGAPPHEPALALAGGPTLIEAALAIMPSIYAAGGRALREG